MNRKYQISRHIKNFIKGELYDYPNVKKRLDELIEEIAYQSPSSDGQPRGNATNDTTSQKAERLISSNDILLLRERLNRIDKVVNSLRADEQDMVRKIFFKGHSQAYAEINDNISKDMYYTIFNKMIYLTAKEYKLI